MYWNVCWWVSLITWGAAFVFAFALLFLRYNVKGFLTPNRVLIFGTWAASGIFLYPMYFADIGGSEGFERRFKAVLASAQHAIRLFGFDGGYLDVVRKVEDLDPDIQTRYTVLGVIIYLVAPILTISLILSFFKDLTARARYALSFFMDAHVFSELNEKSLALAKSIDDVINKVGKGKNRRYKLFRKALIVFTDIKDYTDEKSLMLIEEAKKLDAILICKDLSALKYRNRRLSARKVRFYLISDNEIEKIHHAEWVMKEYDVKGVELRVFSCDVRSELLLAAKSVKDMKVIRVNDVQSLIYHNLDVHGTRLFEGARCVDGREKIISAVIVGLGGYGIEMMKALTWFCQLKGYKLKINAFDIDSNAKERFTYMCPDLMSDEFNGRDIPGDAYYDIKIHSGIDIDTSAFADEFSKIKDATYIFVCLGNDEVNLSTAAKIRSQCERIRYAGDHHKPDVETVIYNSDIRNTMGVKWEGDKNADNPCGVTYFKKQPYGIHMIGDLDSFYSVDTLIVSKLVEEGREVHRRYSGGDDTGFWKYEYDYRSSIAKAMHERLRVKMKLDIPGIEKEWDSRSEEEKLAIGQIEHIRWNAYMRSEGYQYSGSKSKASRNDLGKLHNNLVLVHELSDDDLKKDS